MKLLEAHSRLLLLLCTLAYTTTAQIWTDVQLLKSTRDDVLKSHSGESQLADGSSYYEFEKENITVKYYRSGCVDSIVGELGLSSRPIIEIKVVPKYRLTNAEVTGSRLKSFEKITLAGDKSALIDHQDGFVVIARSDHDYPETVEAMYYIPKTSMLPRCLLEAMDTPVTSALGNSDKWKNGETTEFYTSLTLVRPGLSSLNLRELKLFVETIKRSRRSFGFVYIYEPAEESFWMNRIQTFLAENLGNDKSRLKVIRAGHEKNGIALLTVITKRLED